MTFHSVLWSLHINNDCVSALFVSQVNPSPTSLQRGLTMTSVRNSYIVLSSFPGLASSPHSPQSTFSSSDRTRYYQSRYLVTQPPLLPFFSIWEISSSAQTVVVLLFSSYSQLTAISQPGNVQTAFFPPFVCPSVPCTPTALPSSLSPHLTRALQSLSALKLSIFPPSEKNKWIDNKTVLPHPKKTLIAKTSDLLFAGSIGEITRFWFLNRH